MTEPSHHAPCIHHRRQRRRFRGAMAECAVDPCDRDAYARGWCHKHYQRVLRHGHPGGPDRDTLVIPPGLAEACAARRATAGRGDELERAARLRLADLLISINPTT